MIGATIIAVFMLFMGMFVVPAASKGFNEFKYKYLKRGREDRVTTNIYNQLNAKDYIYVSSFDPARQIGYNFTFERFKEENTLDFKMSAANIRWIEKDSQYRLTSYRKRTMQGDTAIIVTKRRLDTLFAFKIDDLTPVSYVAETKNLLELNKFIEDQRIKGASNINSYILVKYKRWALPLSVFILTIIAVGVASVKRRGGMGLNLAFGIVVAFVYIFFDRVFSTLAEQAGLSPLLAIIVPNLFFGILAFVVLQKAKR
jgi:lipopolysaccharide export system permease protein